MTNNNIGKLKERIVFLENSLDQLVIEAREWKDNFLIENFYDKEKKLSELKENLEACQIDEAIIQKEIEKNVEELNNSNLSKEEKNQKMIEIMTGDTRQLKLSRQKLNQMWKSFSQSKDILLEAKENLSNSRLKAIESLEKTKHNLWITVWVLIGVVVLLSLSLSLYCYKQKAKK